MHTIGCTELSDPAGHADSGTRPGGGRGIVFGAGGGGETADVKEKWAVKHTSFSRFRMMPRRPFWP